MIGIDFGASPGNYRGILGKLKADDGLAFVTSEKSQKTNIGVAKEKMQKLLLLRYSGQTTSSG